MAKIKNGLTLAGRLWLEKISLEFGLDGRMARGRTYFNKEHVKKFTLVDNEILAKVKGSHESYDVYFGFKKDSEKEQKVSSFINSNHQIQSSLLNGDLPDEFFSWAESENIELFVKLLRWQDGNMRLEHVPNYEANCDCYDFYDTGFPCKHIFALWYAIAQEIDHNPTMLLKINGIETILTDENRSDDVPYPIQLGYWEEELTKKSKKQTEPAPLTILHQEDTLAFIISLMPSNPPFAPIDYKDVMKEFYKANKLKLPQLLSPIFSDDIDKIERVFKESKIEIIVDTNFRTSKAVLKHKVFTQEASIMEIMEPYIFDQNSQGCSVDLLSFARLFLSFKSEYGSGHYRYFYQLCRVGYLSLNSNAFIPAVVKEKSKSRFFVVWTPLVTKTFTEQLGHIAPNAVASIKSSARSPFYDADTASLMFLTALFTEYARSMEFMHKKLSSNPPEISKTFFYGDPYVQKGGGKHNIDKAVANTFSIFMLSKSKYQLGVHLKLNKQNEYEISLKAKNTQSNSTKDFCDEIKNDSLKELVKLVGPITLFLPEIEHFFTKKKVVLDKSSFESFILERAHLLSSLGVDITLPKELHGLIKPKLALSVKSKKTPASYLDLQGLLEYDWVIAIGDYQLSGEEFAALVKEQGQIVKYKDQYITITPEELKNLLSGTAKKAKLSHFDILREKFSGNVFFDQNLEDFFAELFKPKEVLIPKSLNANLRAYQARGVEWAISNLLNNFGVILADDMGLGKTIQAITIMLYLNDNSFVKTQILVVAPTTLLNNWQNELTKFAPSLSNSLFYGQSRKIENTKVVITTYDTLKRDETLLKNHFDIVVIDEAQKIKNPDTVAATAVKSIKAKYKIALSGTPVENSLSELWSIFDFSLKGYLGDRTSFINKYAKPIEIEKNLDVANKLKNITSPFMLRRLKTDKNIISDLPDKIVIDEYASMTPKQAAIYQNIVDDTMKKLETMESSDRLGIVFKLITELKQVCNHPRNFDKTTEVDFKLSGKTELLLELLENIITKGEKVLIFTQYVEMAKILCEIIEKEMLIEPLQLDGSMSKKAREDVVERFQSGSEYPIFVLSLKAGGVGLNLTAATNVIHYDLWFNPAVENQATDRAFRIGQKNSVFVYRFITKNSFEEKIDNMIKAKTAIGDMSVFVGEKSLASMSNDEMRLIFDAK